MAKPGYCCTRRGWLLELWSWHCLLRGHTWPAMSCWACVTPESQRYPFLPGWHVGCWVRVWIITACATQVTALVPTQVQPLAPFNMTAGFRWIIETGNQGQGRPVVWLENSPTSYLPCTPILQGRILKSGKNTLSVNDFYFLLCPI